ncbi:MAG: hypothetical protein L6R28_25105 [Planctomycetes bacterium]|nr:hypothetical protein [Planctomycetota bacterium]
MQIQRAASGIGFVDLAVLASSSDSGCHEVFGEGPDEPGRDFDYEVCLRGRLPALPRGQGFDDMSGEGEDVRLAVFGPLGPAVKLASLKVHIGPPELAQFAHAQARVQQERVDKRIPAALLHVTGLGLQRDLAVLAGFLHPFQWRSQSCSQQFRTLFVGERPALAMLHTLPELHWCQGIVRQQAALHGPVQHGLGALEVTVERPGRRRRFLICQRVEEILHGFWSQIPNHPDLSAGQDGFELALTVVCMLRRDVAAQVLKVTIDQLLSGQFGGAALGKVPFVAEHLGEGLGQGVLGQSLPFANGPSLRPSVCISPADPPDGRPAALFHAA